MKPIALVLALALGPTGQNAGVPTLDLSENRVKAAGSTASRSLAARAADVTNVLDFIPSALHAGIKAGTDASDVTSYFYAAMNVGKHVYVPPGVYHVNLDLTQIADANGLTLEGVGYGDGFGKGSKLVGYDATRPIIKGIWPSYARGKAKLTFTGLHLNQTGGPNSATNHGVQLEYAGTLNFTRVHVVNVGGYALHLTRATITSITDCLVHKGSAARGLGGVYMTGATNDTIIQGGSFYGADSGETTAAVTLAADATRGGNLGGLWVIGTDIEKWGIGTLLDNTHGRVVNVVLDAWYEQNHGCDVQIGVKGKAASIEGVEVKGVLVGPVPRKDGHAVRLWGSTLHGIDIAPRAVNDRTAVVDLYAGVAHYGTKIRPGRSFSPLVSGTVVPGIEIEDNSVRSYGANHTFGAGTGPVVVDSVTSIRYRLGVASGVVSLTAVPQNLLKWSEALDAATSGTTWFKGDNIAVTANTTLAPDGSTTADTLAVGALESANLQYTEIGTLSALATYTASIHLKYTNHAWWRVMIYDNGSSNFLQAWFNVQTGAVGTTTQGGAGSGVTAAVAPAANGFYRVSISGVPGWSGKSFILVSPHTANGASPQPKNISGVAWGAQLVSAALPGAYTATGAFAAP